ncbi:periplasmic binding protein-like I [Phlyctochytrium arcticum]|nr:periplasmic binding protein-like I [Phlyctochytrium arcticum]
MRFPTFAATSAAAASLTYPAPSKTSSLIPWFLISALSLTSTLLQVHAQPPPPFTTLTYAVVLASTDPFITSFRAAIDLAVADINADSALLPGANLQVRFYDSEASPRVVVAQGLKALAEGVNGIIGEADSGITGPLVLAAQTKSIPVCSGASTSPDLTNKKEYATFFRTLPSDDAQGAAIISLCQAMKWGRIGLIAEATAYGQGVTDAVLDASAANGQQVTIDARLSIVMSDKAQIRNQLTALKDSGVRIIVAIGADVKNFPAFMRIASSIGLVGDDYVWVLSDAYLAALADMTSANALGEDKQALKGALAVYPQEGFGPKYQAYRASGKTENPYDLFYYDCVLAMAHAHTKQLAEGVTLANLAAGINLPTFNIETFTRVNFTGMTGPVAFAPTGNRNGLYALYNFDGQKQSQVGTIQNGTIAKLADISFHSGSSEPPRDSPELKINIVAWLSALGILFTFLFGVMVLVMLASIFYIFYNRSNPILRPVSPTFCALITLGLLLVYLSEVFDIGYRSTLTCNIYPWMLGVGFITILGAVFVKQWRIYRIFENVHLAKHGIRDARLLIIFGGILAVQVVLLLAMTAGAPLKQLELTNKRAETRSFICRSDNELFQSIITYIILGYCGLMLLVCTYLAIRTRNVYSAYNESKWIGLSVYNIILCGFAALTVTFIGGSDMSESVRFAVRNATVFFAATVAYVSLVGRLLWVIYFRAAQKSAAAQLSATTDNVLQSTQNITSGGESSFSGMGRNFVKSVSALQSATPRAAAASLVNAQLRQTALPMRISGSITSVWKMHTMTLLLGGEKLLTLFETPLQDPDTNEAPRQAKSPGYALRLRDVKARLLLAPQYAHNRPEVEKPRHCRFEIRWGNTGMVVQAASISDCEEWVYLINSGGVAASSTAASPLFRTPRDVGVLTAGNNSFGQLPMSSSSDRKDVYDPTTPSSPHGPNNNTGNITSTTLGRDMVVRDRSDTYQSRSGRMVGSNSGLGNDKMGYNP